MTSIAENCLRVRERIDAPVACFAGLVLVGSSRGVLYALDASLGGEKWRAQIFLPLTRQAIVLAIDDNADIVALFQRYLAGHAVSVVGAKNAEDALRLAVELQPQVITLDIMIPNQDGWEILQKLKTAPETKHIPVIICSVLHEPQMAQAMGASGYVTKPVSQERLVAVLRRWLVPLSPAA